MAKQEDLRETAFAAIRSEKRIGPHFKPETLTIDADGVATIESEVETVAIKRLALERLGGVPGIGGIVDRLRVKPASPMSDRRHLGPFAQDLLPGAGLPAIRHRGTREGSTEACARRTAWCRGQIDIEVEHGVVTLNGSLPSLAAKRLAGVLAWWVPGVRDVVNGITVDPPEDDAPIQVEEAVRVALDKDPLFDASQIRTGVRGRTVRLTGWVQSAAAREAAEWDAWYVFGVDDVINEIETGF